MKINKTVWKKTAQWICVYAALSAVRGLGQEGQGTLPSVDLLHPGGTAAGSFDPGWRARVVVRGDRGNQATGATVAADASTPAADGTHYLKIEVAGGDAERLSATASLSSIPVDLAKGRRFRLEWQVWADGENPLQAGNGKLIFFADGDARSPLKVLTSKSFSMDAEDWQAQSVEFVYDGEPDVKALEMRLGFWRSIPNGRHVIGGVLVDGVRLWQINDPSVKVGQSSSLEEAKSLPPPEAPIPVTFTVPKAGEVTLVMEDKDGVRVGNLIEGVFYRQGTHTFLWDGLDAGDQKYKAGGHADYSLNRKIVAPGTYRVRGLVHDPLKLTYDFTAYPTIGEENVPWPTHLHNGDGGWLADHGVPHAAAFIPAASSPYGEDVVALAAAVSEAAPAMAYVNMAGKKLGGFWRLGGHWTGASHFAVDRGAHPNPRIFLYSIKSWQPKRGAPENSCLIKILGLSKQGNFEVDYPVVELPEGMTWGDGSVSGLAVHDGLLVFSLPASDALYFYDTSRVDVGTKGTLVKRLDLADVNALAFEEDGSLLVLVGKTLKRFQLKREDPGLVNETLVVKNGLEDPQQLMVAPDGRIFVADWGDSHQIKVFNANGERLQTIGTAGPVRSGPYVETHMNRPYGMALDSRGRLWVAERSRLPKRVSVWNLSSEHLERAFYGPTQYGGGGVLDPKDSSILYYANAHGCMSLKLDREKGTGIPERIVYRNEEVEATGGKARFVNGHFPMYHGERRYITNAYTGPTTGDSMAEFWLDGAVRARPKTFIGALAGFRYFALEPSRLGAYFPLFTDADKPTNPRELRMFNIQRSTFLRKTLACWIDRSNDGRIDPDEMTFLSFADREDIGRILGTEIGKDFEILVTHEKGVMRIPSDGFSAEGHPLYDLAKVEHPIRDLSLRGSSGGNQTLRADDGSIIITGGPMQGFVNGKQVWRIHSQWPSLHAGHAAPSSPEYPGQMLSTTRLLGPLVRPRSGDAGQIWGINSDKGVMYLITSDGLFLSTLGRFGQDAKQWVMDEAVRGMDVTDINHIPENFYPTLNQGEDGGITIISGKSHISLLSLSGLESVQRFSAPDLVVDAAVIEQAKTYGRALAAWERTVEGTGQLKVVKRPTPIKVDGQLDEWEAADWVTISEVTEQHGWGRPMKVPEATAAWAVDDTHLYVAVRSQRETFIENSGRDPETFFSTGGGVDIRLAAMDGSVREGRSPEPVPGDVRLIAARHEGTPVAFLYRASVPGVENPVTFSSPVSSIQIDRIDEVSDQVSFAAGSTRLASTLNPKKQIAFSTLELSIPLAVLGWDPEALPKTIGDIGLLFGSEGRTVERSYWHNKAAGIVSDLPSEAGLNVGEWGPVELQ